MKLGDGTGMMEPCWVASKSIYLLAPFSSSYGAVDISLEMVCHLVMKGGGCAWHSKLKVKQSLENHYTPYQVTSFPTDRQVLPPAHMAVDALWRNNLKFQNDF